MPQAHQVQQPPPQRNKEAHRCAGRGTCLPVCLSTCAVCLQPQKSCEAGDRDTLKVWGSMLPLSAVFESARSFAKLTQLNPAWLLGWILEHAWFQLQSCYRPRTAAGSSEQAAHQRLKGVCMMRLSTQNAFTRLTRPAFGRIDLSGAWQQCTPGQIALSLKSAHGNEQTLEPWTCCACRADCTVHSARTGECWCTKHKLHVNSQLSLHLQHSVLLCDSPVLSRTPRAHSTTQQPAARSTLPEHESLGTSHTRPLGPELEHSSLYMLPFSCPDGHRVARRSCELNRAPELPKECDSCLGREPEGTKPSSISICRWELDSGRRPLG